jgi:hypothetical protein
MVAGAWNAAIAEAVRMSSAIENSGQCTALRHLVAPGATDADIVEAYGKQPVMDAAVDALAAKEFSAIFTKQPFSLAQGYTAHPSGAPSWVLGDTPPRCFPFFLLCVVSAS